jgi:hypothetical protein
MNEMTAQNAERRMLGAQTLPLACCLSCRRSDQTDRFLNVSSSPSLPSSEIIQKASDATHRLPTIAARREHPSPRIQLHSNSECNSNSTPTQLSLKKRKYVQHRQCVANCMRMFPQTSLISISTATFLQNPKMSRLHLPLGAAIPQCNNVPTCNVHPNVGDLP